MKEYTEEKLPVLVVEKKDTLLDPVLKSAQIKVTEDGIKDSSVQYKILEHI